MLHPPSNCAVDEPGGVRGRNTADYQRRGGGELLLAQRGCSLWRHGGGQTLLHLGAARSGQLVQDQR